MDTKNFDRRKLREAITRKFADDDLRTICFDLKVDYETLAGDTKLTKVVSLIQYFETRDKVRLLIERCSEERASFLEDDGVLTSGNREVDELIERLSNKAYTFSVSSKILELQAKIFFLSIAKSLAFGYEENWTYAKSAVFAFPRLPPPILRLRLLVPRSRAQDERGRGKRRDFRVPHSVHPERERSEQSKDGRSGGWAFCVSPGK